MHAHRDFWLTLSETRSGHADVAVLLVYVTAKHLGIYLYRVGSVMQKACWRVIGDRARRHRYYLHTGYFGAS